jgi:DNA-binding LytR/AlgR family response regulator
MNAVLGVNVWRIPSFWRLQAVGWCCFCLLCALVVVPYVTKPGELGYQSTWGLFVDQGLMCLVAFFASLALRPVCRSLVRQSRPWITLEVRAAGWSLVMGTSAALIASRFIIAKPEVVELLEACAKMSTLLFLWSNLYFSIKQSQWHSQERHSRMEREAYSQERERYVSRFTVRAGSRIQVVSAEDVEWVAAAGDYAELHTRNGAHLLRETMSSLEKKLDPARFARIHRSRIVSLAQILELRAVENREYVVKLSDGSQHRSSRMYADRIDRWLRGES